MKLNKFSFLLFLLTAVFFFDASTAHAQRKKRFVRGQNRYSFGGIAMFSAGFSFDFGKTFQQNLEKTNLLHGSLPPFGFNIGGTGYLLFARNFIISGTGYLLNYQNTINKSNEMEFGGYGGSGGLGYVVYSMHDMVLYPAVEVGYISRYHTIRNTADSLIHYGDLEIPMESKAEFEFSQIYVDLSINFTQLMRFNFTTTDGASGVAFGVSIGYSMGLGDEFWKIKGGESVSGIDPTKANMLYIKLSFGGGGFFIK